MSIGRDSLAYWTSQIANFALSFVSSVFVSVILGPERRGLVNAVILANTLGVNLTNLGLQSLSMFFVGKTRGQLAQIHRAVLLIVAAIALIDFALVALFGDFLRGAVFHDIGVGYLMAALAALPFSLYFFAAQGVLTGLGRIARLARLLFYYSACVNGANLAAVGLLDRSPEGTLVVKALLVVFALSQIGAAAAAFALIRRAGGVWGGEPLGETLARLRRLLSYGLRAFVGNFATGLINRIDHIFILASLGQFGIGIYGLSAKLAELLYQPSAAFVNAGYSRVVSADERESARLVQELFRMNFLINSLGLLAMIAFARPFVLFFYSDEYREAVAPLRILLPGALMLASSRILALYFSAQLGRPQIPSAIAWATLAVNASAMGYVVIERGWGLTGAACVTTGSYGMMLTIYLVMFGRRTGLVNPLAFFVPQRRDAQRIAKLLGEAMGKRRGIKTP